MPKTIKAKYSKGVLEPLEKLDIEEGKELTVTILEVFAEKADGGDSIDITFGGWVGLIDADELKKNIYADRLIASRPPVRL